MEVNLLKGKHQDQARYKNYVFAIKTKGKNATMFRCIFKGCHGSISLKADNYTLVEPYRITNLNENHIDSCHPYHDDHFEIKNFLSNVKSNIVHNLSKPTQQVYEESRALHRKGSDTALPDYQ